MRLYGTVFSETLHMDTGISVITPKLTRGKSDFKVAYMLHGLGGSSKTWCENTKLPYYALNGNTVYIMPEVQRGYYTDMHYGQQYFSYITSELPKLCGDMFNISAKPENTFIIGFSMGGYGALKCAIARPDVFGSCAAFAPCALFLRDYLPGIKEHGVSRPFTDRFGIQLNEDYVNLFGEDYTCKREDDIPGMMRELDGKGSMPRIYLACGKDDIFHPDCVKFASFAEKTDADFVYEEWEGNHNADFWDSALKRTIGRFDL